jgi:GNAT superfamily N-acetyltransferase
MRQAWPDLEPLLEGIMAYHRPWDPRTPIDGWTSRIFEFMEKEGVTFLARDASGKVIGFLNGLLRKDQGVFLEPFAFVSNAFVEEDVRSLGVGTALLLRFEAWATADGAQDIRLNVNAANDLGLSFWRKNGFQTFEYILRKPLVEAAG